MKIIIVKDDQQPVRQTDAKVKRIDEIDALPIGTYTEIILDRTLDLVNNQERDKILNSLLAKLRYNGIITIIGYDYYELARQIYLCNITVENEISNLFESLQSISTVQSVVKKLESLKLQISFKSLDNIEYIISGKKVVNK